MSKTALPMTMLGEGGVQLLPRTRTEMVYDGEHTLSEYITNGVFNVAHGGTGLSSIAKDKMLYASAANTLAEVTTSAFGRGLLNATSGNKIDGLYATKADGVTVGTAAGDAERRIVCHNGDSLFDADGITLNYYHKRITATTFKGALDGNASTASALTNLTSSDVASPNDTWRKVWMSYANGVTGRPALSDSLAFQTSTNTLKTGNLSATNDVNAGGNVIAQGGVAAMGIADADGNPTLRLYSESFANSTITADTDKVISHNLGNANPMVYVLETNTTSVGDNDYKPMTHGTGGSTFYIKYVDANTISLNMGSTHVGHKIKVFVIG